jgi:hypothetical protein
MRARGGAGEAVARLPEEVVVYGGYEKLSELFLSALGTAALAVRKETPSSILDDSYDEVS